MTYEDKTSIDTSINIHEMNKRSDYNEISRGNDDKGENHLLRNVESMVIVIKDGFYFGNTPQFTICIPYETKDRDDQYNK